MRAGSVIGFMVWTFASMAAGETVAETVSVRSGAHDGFSRIVFDMTRQIPFELTGAGDTRRLTFAQAGLSFDTSAVFVRITAERVRSLTPVAGRSALALELGCVCEVDAFWASQSMLVLDVRDAPSQADAAAPETTAILGDVDNIVAVMGADLVPLVPVESEVPSEPVASAAVKLAEGIAGQLTAASLETLFPEARAAVPEGPVSFAREQLAQQIAHAASLGLLEGRPVREQTEALAAEPNGAAERAEAVTPPNINLHAETSVDHDVLERFSQAVQTAEGTNCFADQHFDVASWGTDASFTRQIGAARAALSGEFDRTSPEAVLQLARLYLFFGFGAESRQAMALTEVEGQALAVSLAMAEILETGRAEPSVLSGQIGCDAPVALWSALSYEALPANMPVQIDAVLRALTALPAHLRRHLGPQLARKFVAGGQAPAAGRVLRIVDRIPEEPVTEQALAHAEMSIAEGAPEAADPDLQTVVDANTEGSAEALVKQIDTRLKAGRGVPAKMADLAGAYAHEYRDTPLGKELSRAYIEAMAASGDFDTAIHEAERLEKDLSDTAKDQILATLLGLLTSNADDLTFLRIGTDLGRKAERVPPGTANAAAARMLDLGFADLARPYVTPPATGQPFEQRRLLRAELALMEGAPRPAQIELLGLEGQDADRLRARARSMLGEHLAAHALYLAAGDMRAALREALLAEAWQQAVDIGDPGLADVVEAGAATPADGLTGVLARNRALLESSVTARETVAALLEERALPAIE